jgi:hypothetical protein
VSELEDRVDDLKAWARSRIAQCQCEELKYGRILDRGARQVCVEAATERRALQAVLSFLEPECSPSARTLSSSYE